MSVASVGGISSEAIDGVSTNPGSIARTRWKVGLEGAPHGRSGLLCVGLVWSKVCWLFFHGECERW